MKALTKPQREALAYMVDHGGRAHSGRNASVTLAVARALEAKGFVRRGKDHTWETDWHLTAPGRAAWCAVNPDLVSDMLVATDCKRCDGTGENLATFKVEDCEECHGTGKGTAKS